jgi:hypothetical protein
MKAPNYDWGDLVYYAGLLLGLGLSYTLVPQFGVTNDIACLIVGVLAGAGIGYYLETQFRARTGLTKRSD